MRIISLFLVFTFVSLFSQKYSSFWYTTDNGLPQNSVKDIVKDRNGYIWLSTEQGIVRYDGHRLLTYQNLGINNFHFKIFFGSTAHDSIMILSDQNRDCLLISERKPIKLSRYKTEDGEFFSGQFYTYYRKRSFGDLPSFGLYMICLRTGKYLFSEGKVIFLKQDGSVTEIRMPFSTDKMKDTFVIGETLFIRDSVRGIITSITNGEATRMSSPLITDPKTVVYWEQINNQVFIICEDNVYLVNYSENKLTASIILNYPKFGTYRFYSMYYDSEYKILYLGSLLKGLQILRLFNFSCVKRDVDYEEPLFNTLLPYRNNDVITPDGLVYNSTLVIKDFRFNKSNSKNSMLYDELGNVICFEDNKLEIYDHRNLKQLLTRKIFDFNIRHIFRSGGSYFLCTQKGKTDFIIEFTDHTYSKVKRSIKLNSTANCIRRFNKYFFFVGCLDGLYLLDKRSGDIKKLTGVGGVRTICRTSEGNFWALTYSDGIFLIKNSAFVKMPMDEKNSLASSHDLLEDRNGFLWISTNNGLYKVHKKKLLDYSKFPETAVHYYRYSTKDGLNTNEFNGAGNPGAAVLKNGSFVFPSMDGLVFFRPEFIISLFPAQSSISVERVKVGDSISNFNTKLVLAKNFQSAQIYIDIPYYGHNENLILEAEVDNGEEKKWSRIGEERTFIIEKLSPGNHILNIRAVINMDGKYTYKKIPFYIEPYFYQTNWFRLLLVTGSFSGIILLIKTFTNSLRKKLILQKNTLIFVRNKLEQTEIKLEKETNYQEDLFQAITHDIATPIKHLSNLSQMMLKTDNPQLQKEYFDSVYKSTEELYKLTMSLKEYRNAFNSEVFVPKPYVLYEVIDTKVGLFADMAKYNHTEIINRIPKDIKLNINQNMISIIFQNLLDNAVKNTVGGTIIFDYLQEGDNIIITLSDTGKGMMENQIKYYNELYITDNDEDFVFRHFGLGLHLVIRLVKKLNSQIVFSANKPNGTIITIKFTNICLKKY